jgi:glucan phosphoethanolaminetransferase (alkaline phosphatase superfamily)
MVFLVMPRFLSLFSEIGFGHFPVFSTAVFAVGPMGWLLVMLVIGTLVILKDFRFPSRSLNAIFTAILALLIIGIIFVLMQFDTYSSGIGEAMGQ